MPKKPVTKASDSAEEQVQTTHDPPEKPKRTRKKKEEPAEQPATERQEEKKKPARSYDGNIITLNEEERGFTAEDSEGILWTKLSVAYYERKILSGTIVSVENLKTNAPICSVDYHGILILIPGHEMFADDWPTNRDAPRAFQERLNGMLGATVEFMLRGVDLKNYAAVASRRDALKERCSKYYATGRVVPGVNITCRVIRAAGSNLTVEALGVDTVIPASDVSWEWFSDVALLYAPGDLVVAKVMAVDFDKDTETPTVRLSVKATTENPDISALKHLTPGSVYFGVVTGVVDRVIFVRLQTGANAKTMTFRSDVIPSKNDTVCFQVMTVDLERCMAFGVVTRIIKRFGRYR